MNRLKPYSEAEDLGTARYVRYQAKRRLEELRDPLVRSDPKRLHFVSRMISGGLDPRVVRDRSEFSKASIIAYCAPQLNELSQTLEHLAIPVSSAAPPVLDAILRLWSLGLKLGGFYIWAKRPRLARCEGLIRAAQSGEDDFEEYLAWFRKHQLGLQASPRDKLDTGNQLDAYILQVLLRMHTSGGAIVLPGDMHDLGELSEEDLYHAIEHRARHRKRLDEDGTGDRIRLTVEHETSGKIIRRYGIALKDTLPDVTRDPIEFLLSSRQPVKLADLAAMRAELASDERCAQLKLTLDEYAYLKFHHGGGMTQNEVAERLGWDDLKIQRIRRNADLKVQRYRESQNAEKTRRRERLTDS